MQVLLTAETVRLIGNDFRFTRAGERELKGFGTCTLMALEEERGG